MSSANLFERAGGVEGVNKLVGEFYQRVLTDPELAPFFAGIPMERLQRMQVELFSTALGGPVVYSGRSMREVHAGRGIEHAHVQRFVEHLLETVKGLDLDENDINAIYSRLAIEAAEVSGDPTEDG